MKHASLMALIALPAAAVAQSPAVQNRGVPVTKTVIAGIPVIQKRVTANDVIAVQVYLKGGSGALTPGMGGIENLLGNAMTKGTVRYDKAHFTALATSTGTTIGASVGYDFTTFTLQGVRQNWAQAWDLFTQVVLHPTFPANEVAQVAGQIANDLKQHQDDPDTYLAVLSDSAMYAGHPYAMDPEGKPESITKFTRDDLARWHKSRLTKSNLLIVVVGNVSPLDLKQRIGAAFGSLPAAGGEARRPSALASAKGAPVIVKRDLPTNYITGVFAAPGPSHPDFAAMRVAMLVLSDRLFEEVRTKRNLSYAVFSQLSTRAVNRGRIYVTATDPDTTLKVMLAETRRLQDEPVPASRLGEQVGVFATGYFMGQQTNMGQATSLGLWELAGGGYRNAITYVDRLRAVKPADVQRVSRAYLKDFRFAAIGDPAKVSAALPR